MTASLTVAGFAEALGRSMPWSQAADWDPVGLVLGDPRAGVETAAVCHDVTEAVVGAVAEGPAGVLIAYHPLLLRPVARLVAGPGPVGRAFRLIAAGVALVVPHTAFDVAPGGTADALAAALGLGRTTGFGPLWGRPSVKVVTFAPRDHADAVAAAMADAGAGTIGTYTACSFRVNGTGTFLPGPGSEPFAGDVGALQHEDETRIEVNVPESRLHRVVAALVAAHPYEQPAYDVVSRKGDAGFVGRVGDLERPLSLADLAALVARALGPNRVAGDRSRRVSRVAVLPGSGRDFIGDAVAAGADVLVTGDVTHHRAAEALDRGLAVIDPGHAATETPGVARLYAAVSQLVPAVDLTAGADPWTEGA